MATIEKRRGDWRAKVRTSGSSLSKTFSSKAALWNFLLPGEPRGNCRRDGYYRQALLAICGKVKSVKSYFYNG